MKNLLFLLFCCLLGSAQTQMVITSITQYTCSAPTDRHSSNKRLECIGPIGGGAPPAAYGDGGGASVNGASNGGASGLYGGRSGGQMKSQNESIAGAKGILA